MKLSVANPSINDRTGLYLDQASEVSNVATSRIISGTVIGIYYSYSPTISPSLYLIGWMPGTNMPKDRRMAKASTFISSTNTQAFKFSPDKNLYDQAMWVDHTSECCGIVLPKTVHIPVYSIDEALSFTAPKHMVPETKCKNTTCSATVFMDDAKCWNCLVSNPGKP